jgi:hypothetical protein
MSTIALLYKSKTFWVAVSAMAGSVAAFAGGEIGLKELLIAMVVGLLAIFNREGTEKARLGK